jgi:phage anti-repressor protein
MEFSHELALSLIQSAKPFPVDFEQGWQWLGYSSKHKAKEKLQRNFAETIDFEVYTQMGVNSAQQALQGGRPSERIFLSIDCFKSLGMMAGTSKGKEVRQYFLQCERIAKQAVETIPAQSARIRELELELQVAQAQASAAQSQERLMQATSAIATLHGSGMVALILGKPDAVITHTEVIEKTVAVDPKGRVLSQSDGLTIGYLTKRLGFKNNEQTWQWLNSVQLGKDSGAWSKELTAHPTLKLPRHLLPQIQRLFAYQVGNRQLLLGEGGGR